jgi:aminoglycoside phosphotransferase (APT) family kinase protein
MADELRAGLKSLMETEDKFAIEARLQELKEKFPDGAPYVLTHADLHLGNMMVHDGKIEAIIDWETAGYYPRWVQRWTTYQHSINGDHSDFLFNLVWAELDPDMSREQFESTISTPVWELAEAWKSCDMTHTESHDVWFRPLWCGCKPIGGLIRRKDVDSELKHLIGPDHHKTWPTN